MQTLKIFGDLSKTARMVEMNMTNGMIPLALSILEKDTKYNVEVRIWALIILNRGTMHTKYAHEFLDRVLKVDPPLFLEFMLYIAQIEDIQFTMHTKLLWQEIEKQSKAGTQALFQQFLDNAELVEKILLASQKTQGSKSGINHSIQNTIRYLSAKHPELDSMF